MKLFYDEDMLYRIMREQVIPNIPKDVFSIPNHLIFANLQKLNGDSFNQSCIISINNEGLLFAFMDPVKTEKVLSSHFSNFKDMQGVAIKSGIFSMKIIIQYKNGTRYQLLASKKNVANLPHQRENLGYIISVLAAKNLNDMTNSKFNNMKKESRKFSFLYVITLFLALMIPLCFIDVIKSKLVFSLIAIGIGIIHFIIFLSVNAFLEKRKNKKFNDEYNKIIEKYNETKDDYWLYCSLKNISNSPLTKDTKNPYYFSLSTAAANIGHHKEAIDYLDMVEYIEGDYTSKLVNQQKADIKNRS